MIVWENNNFITAISGNDGAFLITTDTLSLLAMNFQQPHGSKWSLSATFLAWIIRLVIFNWNWNLIVLLRWHKVKKMQHNKFCSCSCFILDRENEQNHNKTKSSYSCGFWIVFSLLWRQRRISLCVLLLHSVLTKLSYMEMNWSAFFSVLMSDVRSMWTAILLY